jgi:hypothetical protein
MSHWLIFGRVNLNFSDLENMIFTPAIRRVYVESTCKNPLEPHSSTPYCKEELLATGIKVARRIFALRTGMQRTSLIFFGSCLLTKKQRARIGIWNLLATTKTETSNFSHD